MTFQGTVNSDFLKLPIIEDIKKVDLIDFAATDFITIRAKLIEYIKAVYPLDYQSFVESDLGMFLIENWSYVATVMSMKADMLANENFLATAKNRNNVRKLLELVGVSMRGPISSIANARITLDSSALQFTIPRSGRVISVTSPEDGAPLNFTIYKTTGGVIDDVTTDSSLVFNDEEAEGADQTEPNPLIWQNLVLIEGALVFESGLFNTTEVVKTIPLTQSPVVEGSVQVFIDDSASVVGAWTEVPNIFFASGSTADIYQVDYSDDFAATIIFGDGRSGSIPPANATYKVTYRVGGGTRGRIGNEVINVPLVTNASLNGVIENITEALGGLDAETVEHAKKYAPLTFKRQDRIVSLSDYKNFVNAFVGIAGLTGKATAATSKAFSSANVIDVYLLQVASPTQLQQATVSFKEEILTALDEKKILTTEVVVVDGLIRTLDLVMTLYIDKSNLPNEEVIKGKVRNVLLDYFNVDNFDFGQMLSLSDLNRVVFTVDEVRFSEVANLDGDVSVDFNEIIQLNNLALNITPVG